MRLRTSLLLVAALAASACAEGPLVATPAPVTTLAPPPGAFNGSVTVTLTTDRPAKLRYTLDGTDPAVATATEADAPVTLTFEESTTIRFFATDGLVSELARDAYYLRAGGPKGTASGVVVVDTVAIGMDLALVSDGDTIELAAPATRRQEIPFTISNLETGSHRLRAMADRDADGNFIPVLDLQSDAYTFEIDLDDPLRASVEGIRLHLGASLEGLCTIEGDIDVPGAAFGQSVSISALGGGAFGGLLGGGGGGDPTALLAQLQNGYQVFAREGTTEYPYAITDLEPGPYVPVPLLTSLGQGGLGLNFLANPLNPINCGAGTVHTKNFAFGEAGVSGTVTLDPTTPAEGFVYGIVAARQVSLTDGLQIVLMPVLFLGANEDGTLDGTYAGQGLRSGTFGMRVFTSLDADNNPLVAALTWAINPFASEPAHAQLRVTNADVVQDLTITLP